MKTLKKLMTCFICMAMLFSLAIPAFAAEPRVAVRKCFECTTGNVYQYTSRAYQHDETFPCSHGGNGKDTYAVYEVTISENCDRCTYSYSYTYEDHVLKYCPAK